MKKVKKEDFKKSIDLIQDYFLGTEFYGDLTPKQKSDFNEVIYNIKDFHETQDYRFDDKGNLEDKKFDEIYLDE